jgi:hypothetical protein
MIWHEGAQSTLFPVMPKKALQNNCCNLKSSVE